MTNNIICKKHDEGNPLWTVSIFSSREQADILTATLMAAIDASKGIRTMIDVVVNGNEVLAQQLKEAAMASSAGGTDIVWSELAQYSFASLNISHRSHTRSQN